MSGGSTAIEFIEAGGERLEILRIGAARPGPTLVFLHEGLGSVEAWRDFPSTVADEIDAPGLVYSRRGYGRSEPLGASRSSDYLHREAFKILPAVLSASGIDRCVLVGHSDGGSIALLYAARFSPLGIAIMAPHVFVEDVTLAGIRDIRALWDDGRLRAQLARFHSDPDGAFFGWNDAWLDPRFRAWSIEGELPRVRCPVVAIQGFDDQYGTMEQLDRIERGVVGSCRLLKLERCGHSPQRDRPDAVRAAIAELYRTVS